MADIERAMGPAERDRELREEREQLLEQAEAALAEETSDLEKEAEARAGGLVEEAERWHGVNTDDEAIEQVLNRAVVEIIERDELREKLKSGRQLRVKLGIDPTGPLLHLGRTVPLFKMRQFQDLGHQLVLIIGDFTALVGDASDKDAQRPMLTREQVESNMATYMEQVGSILDLSKVEFVHNSQWLRPLNFNDVINLASKFTVAQMIQRENFSDRWEQGKPIGIHELLYPLMQGFDSVAIHADIELGGTDQLFNLKVGRALQAEFDQPPQSIMCTNMMVGTDGRKMSTSWGNTIYILDGPSDQFGKIMSMTDDVIPGYMESCTLIPMEEVDRVRLGLQHGAIHPMDAKKRLAWEIVRMYHGEEAANEARSDFERQFQERGMPEHVPTVPLARALADKADESGRVGILDLLITTGMAPNRKQAQRLVEQGGVRVNDARVADRETRIAPEEGMIIKVGRNYVKIVGQM